MMAHYACHQRSELGEGRQNFFELPAEPYHKYIFYLTASPRARTKASGANTAQVFAKHRVSRRFSFLYSISATKPFRHI